MPYMFNTVEMHISLVPIGLNYVYMQSQVDYSQWDCNWLKKYFGKHYYQCQSRFYLGYKNNLFEQHWGP